MRRRKSITSAVVVATTAVPLALLTAAVPGFGAAGTETIAFHGNGPEPLVCTSYPDRTSLKVTTGTSIVLENYTWTSAALDVGRKEPLILAHGEGVTIKLRAGTHDLRLVPDCLVVQVGAVTVTVVRGVGVPGPPSISVPAGPEPTRAGPPGPPRPSGPSPSGGSPETAGPTGVPTPGEGSPTAGPAPADLTDSTGPSTGGAIVGLDGEPVPENGTVTAAEQAAPSLKGNPIIDVKGPFQLTSRPGDQRGGQLLAVIAAICVFGVTAGIIRAILAQRASGLGRI